MQDLGLVLCILLVGANIPGSAFFTPALLCRAWFAFVDGLALDDGPVLIVVAGFWMQTSPQRAAPLCVFEFNHSSTSSSSLGFWV